LVELTTQYGFTCLGCRITLKLRITLASQKPV
jgi:hypothetical protein